MKLRNAVLIGGLLLLAAVSYFIGGRMERATFETPDARLKLAREAFLADEDGAAFKMFEPLASSGNARAQFWLADMYEHGYGVKKDLPAAITWLTRSAEQGLSRAEARLGEVYLKGDETVQDFAKARTWLTKAAMKGDAASQRYLGHMYELGLGVPRNAVEAYAWYENAVLDGDGFAARLRDELVSHMAPGDIPKAEARAKELRAEIKPS
jgi:TPR repeat protein